jgi:hypothetical protein
MEFENRVLRKIFGLEKAVVICGRGELHDEELDNVCFVTQ